MEKDNLTKESINRQERNKLFVGLKFAVKYALTQRELQFILLYLEKAHTSIDLRTLTKLHPSSINHINQMLKLKRIIQLKDRDLNMVKTYEFNEKCLK